MSATTTLLLIRHAETLDNVAERLSGWTDADLSPRGEEQVRRLAEHVNRAHPDVVALYASPLVRARRTAEAIGALIGQVPRFDADLREMHFGELDGLTIEEVRAGWPHLLAADEDEELEDFGWPRGESRSGFTARITAALTRIAADHAGATVCVVTHGGVISTFLALLNGQSAGAWRRWLVANASLTEVAWDAIEGRGVLLRHSDAAHLAELTAEEMNGGADQANATRSPDRP